MRDPIAAASGAQDYKFSYFGKRTALTPSTAYGIGHLACVGPQELL